MKESKKQVIRVKTQTTRFKFRNLTFGAKATFILLFFAIVLMLSCQRLEESNLLPSPSLKPDQTISAQTQSQPVLAVSLDNLTHQEIAIALSDTIAQITEKAVAGVVNIASERMVRYRNPFLDDPFFRKFFDRDFPFPFPKEHKTQSLGSGVVISKDGYILTNNHVIDGAEEIKVYLPDGTERKAEVLGKDPRSDIALLKIDASGIELKPLSFGDSDKIKVGEIVIAIGNPFGLGHTVTMGIVSATGRSRLGITDYENFIQTDAAINPGNSGGALINLKGELIGINTAIASRTGGYQGVGFAIPSNMANFIMNSLIKQGKVIRGWLGVMIQDITPELAQAFGLEKNEGSLISKVFPNSPAEAAGLKRGDVIVQLNGQNIKDTNQLRNVVAATAPGTDVKLVVIREKKRLEIKVKIGELPEKFEEARRQPLPEQGEPTERSFFGLYVRDITQRERQMFDIEPNVFGVIIVDVDPASEAADKGLRPGDVIVEVNQKKIKNMAEFKRAVEEGKGKPYLLLIDHGGGDSSYVVLGK